GVLVTLSGSASATVTTDASGNYSFSNLEGGGTYTVTPSKPNTVFTPPSQTFTNLSANMTASFVGTGVSVTITGRVTNSATSLGVAGVTVSLSGSQSATTTTVSDGDYS